MRIDHIALRCSDRKAVAMFYIDAFGYKYDQKFRIPLGEAPDEYADYADCVVLKPIGEGEPEVFISDGPAGGLIDKWVKEREREKHSLIHHIAYAVGNVQATMDLWLKNKWAEFTTEKPIVCPEDGLIQVFTKPHPLTFLTYEFIQRPVDGKGFCRSSVREIMIASEVK